MSIPPKPTKAAGAADAATVVCAVDGCKFSVEVIAAVVNEAPNSGCELTEVDRFRVGATEAVVVLCAPPKLKEAVGAVVSEGAGAAPNVLAVVVVAGVVFMTGVPNVKVPPVEVVAGAPNDKVLAVVVAAGAPNDKVLAVVVAAGVPNVKVPPIDGATGAVSELVDVV